MEPNEIRLWRPSRFSDIAGTANQARLCPIQLAVAHGQTPSAMLADRSKNPMAESRPSSRS